MNNKKYMSRAELVRLRRESEHTRSMERAAREATRPLSAVKPRVKPAPKPKQKQAAIQYCVSHAARQPEGDSPANDTVMEEIVVGIDIGTTKVCTLVGRVEDDKSIRILGVGIEPSEGIRKGIVVDLAAASRAIKRSVEKAESTSSLEITSGFVSLAGAHVASVNSRGAAGIPSGVIDAFMTWHAHSNRRRPLPFRMTARSFMSSNAASPWMDRKACELRWDARLQARSGNAHHHRRQRHGG
jgi:hypothetical protein